MVGHGLRNQASLPQRHSGAVRSHAHRGARGLAADTLPEGQIIHAGGPEAGGWTIFAVHDSKESWERFRDDILVPRLTAEIVGGFEGQPEESGYELHTLLS